MVTLRRILCPIDFSEHSRAALDHASGLARVFDAELVVLHVVEPVIYPVAYGLPVASDIDVEEQAVAGAQRALEPIVEELAAAGTNARSLVTTGTASLRIVATVEEAGVDLVVMATHGLTGIQHALLGSTAERVVRRCPCPVLSVKGESE